MQILTQQEIDKKAELLHSEQAIERAARIAFEEWGVQLKHIRDNRLYIFHSTGSTWESYCQERWEMSYQRANQLVDAYEITSQLNETLVVENTTISCVLPTRETHTRPLSKLKSAQDRAIVWQRVVENSNGHITAKIVEGEVKRFEDAKEKNWITLTEWQQGERWHGGLSKNTMNKPDEDIEWAALSWNPITGCLHNCEYCYARDIAYRFYPQKFEPSFLPERLSMPSNTKMLKSRWQGDIGYKNVFTCSMADLFGKWVPEEWIREVLNTIKDNPQWNFLLLTKFPIRMAEFNYPDNVWLGTTVDRQHNVERAEKAFIRIKESGFDGTCWLSCEPMFEQLTFNHLSLFDWIIMGGASKSTKTPAYKPPFDDIVHLYLQSRQSDCKIYMKTNLVPNMSDEQRIREYP